jgi:hypothetical protein
MYEGVVELQGKTKDQLYKNVRKWFVDVFKSSKDVIQSEDKEGGQIIGKGWFNTTVGKNGAFSIATKYKVDVSIQIDCRDGKYRYRIYDIATTMDGKTEKDAYAKYWVNVPADQWNETVTKDGNGFTKGQKASMAKNIAAVDVDIVALIASLEKAVKSETDNF